MLAPWKKNYDKPRQHIKKQRHSFAVKCLYSQSYGFSSSHEWIWQVDHKESWALKNRSFELLLEKTLRVPWTARSNQSVPKEINPEYSLKRLMLRLKLQYVGHLMQRADSLEKTLTLGKVEGRRRRGWQRTRWFDGITDSMDMGLSKLQEVVENREVWRAVVHGVAESDMTERLNRIASWIPCGLRKMRLEKMSFLTAMGKIQQQISVKSQWHPKRRYFTW